MSHIIMNIVLQMLHIMRVDWKATLDLLRFFVLKLLNCKPNCARKVREMILFNVLCTMGEVA